MLMMRALGGAVEWRIKQILLLSDHTQRQTTCEYQDCFFSLASFWAFLTFLASVLAASKRSRATFKRSCSSSTCSDFLGLLTQLMPFTWLAFWTRVTTAEEVAVSCLACKLLCRRRRRRIPDVSLFDSPRIRRQAAASVFTPLASS